MAPLRQKRQPSSPSPATKRHGAYDTSSPSTPQRSPMKRRKIGLSAHQKQAMIDNLQLEITERARRLRAQYHLQAQGLRSRIEIRINRIPTSMRKMQMGELLLKHLNPQQGRVMADKPPPVPAKDTAARLNQQKPTASSRPQKRLSDEIARDKENDVEHMDQVKKRARGQEPDRIPVRPGQVLSPTSSNSRLASRGRPASPTKSHIARPASPLKNGGATKSAAAATNALANMVEKAKATRAGGTRKTTTTSSTANAASTGTTTASRARRTAAGTAASKAPASRPATRTGRRVSNNSDTSDGSATLVVRKTAATKPAAGTRKTVMSTIKKGVANATSKRTAPKPAATAPTTSSSGRVLRKRG